MTMNYVRNAYGVPVGRWTIVRPVSGEHAGDEMMVTSCSNYVHARPLFSPQVRRFHPWDLEYKQSDGSWWRYRGPVAS